MSSARSQWGSNEPSLDVYLREINRTALLKREEEVELAKRIQKGDKSALDHLVRANLRFVVSIAKQYSKQGLSIEDLINEGNLGLIKAAGRFDHARGFKFISYAVWWIRQAMLQALAEQSRIVRLPLNRAGALYRISKAKRQMVQELGRNPDAEELAKRVGLPVKEVTETLKISNTHVSLNEGFDEDDENPLLHYLADENAQAPDEETFEHTLAADLGDALMTLDARERRILCLYFGIGGTPPLTLEQIGAQLNLTRERIRQIKEKALARIREADLGQDLAAYIEG